jgi:hypothetical protein
MSQQKVSLLPRFGCSFDFGEAGVVVPFYLEKGIVKSGHTTRGDWIEDVLLGDQLAKIKLTEQRKWFELGLIDHRDRVLLIFPGDAEEQTINFWEALVLICTGRFFSKMSLLHRGEGSTLSTQDLQTLERLQRFFSYETNFGEEKCDTLFDTDRNVFVLRLQANPKQAPDTSILGDGTVFPQYNADVDAIRKVVEQFMQFDSTRLTDKEWLQRTDAIEAAIKKYDNVDLGALAADAVGQQKK